MKQYLTSRSSGRKLHSPPAASPSGEFAEQHRSIVDARPAGGAGFLAVCLRLGNDPVHVAFGPFGSLFSYTWPRLGFRDALWANLKQVGGEPRTERLNWHRDPTIEAEMDDAISQGGFRSASSVAKHLGVSMSTLQRKFPDKYVQLVASHRRCRQEQRSFREESRHQDIRIAVDGLVREGRYPSKTRSFVRAGIYRRAHSDPILSGVWRDAVLKHGILVS